jgi:hypothetical protein
MVRAHAPSQELESIVSGLAGTISFLHGVNQPQGLLVRHPWDGRNYHGQREQRAPPDFAFTQQRNATKTMRQMHP